VKPSRVYAALRSELTQLCGGSGSKQHRIKRFAVVRAAAKDDFGKNDL
jgi:hypothetical protein